MARVSTVTTGTTIDSTNFGNALITDYLSQTDANDQNLASNVTVVAGKYLSSPTVKVDTLTEKTAANGISVSHNMSLSAGKYVKSDIHYFNPAVAPANVEGYAYYDSTTNLIKFYNGTATQTLAVMAVENTATALGSYTPVAGTDNIVIVHSSHATDGGVALFAYENAGWNYTELMPNG